MPAGQRQERRTLVRAREASVRLWGFPLLLDVRSVGQTEASGFCGANVAKWTFSLSTLTSGTLSGMNAFTIVR